MKYPVVILVLLSMVSCIGNSPVFPGNIANMYCLDLIEIDNPVLYCTDTIHNYLTSDRYIEHIEKDNPDSSILMYPVATHDDLSLRDFYWTDYENKHKGKYLERMMSQNGEFLSFDYFDFYKNSESGASIYKFKIVPSCFLLIMVPGYFYFWPPDSDVFGVLSSRTRQLIILPIYSRSQRKKLKNIEKGSNEFMGLHSMQWWYSDINPEDWSRK